MARKVGAGFVDATFEGDDFVRRFVSDHGSLPRLESVLWRRDALTRALSLVDGESDADLRRVIEAVATATQTRIAYVAEMLIFATADSPGPASS